ncbi:MAG TPA: glycerol-3-phosphate 1-O-acyltransferase PlsY [Geobacteraceae bacterium]|nr:glycerol-3-phosphate 1-O-acyltransferase PlsY [Geobacteraceae bacterium]
MPLQELLLILCAYLLGSVPTGLLLARAFGGVDIRTKGSGNIGATNVYRTLGRKIGILTLVGDCLKGMIPVLAAKALEFPDIWIAAVGVAAFLGHIFPVFLGFKGGKGVATALGVFLAASPLAVLAALGVFIIVLVVWRFVSLASITAAAFMPALSALIDGKPMIVAMSLCIAAIVIFKHKDNIKRLRNGTENKFRA